MFSSISNFFKSKYKVLSAGDENEVHENRENCFDQQCPEETCSFFSKLTFGWIQDLLVKGYKKPPLQLIDIYQLPKSSQVKNALHGVKDLNFNSKRFRFLNHIQAGNLLKSTGWGYAISLFVASLVLALSQQYGYWYGMKLSLEIRSAFISLIFTKMLKINNSSKRVYGSGSIMNLISVDVDVFMEFFCVLCYIVGPAGLVGFILMIISLPTNAVLVGRMGTHFHESLKHSDSRVSMIGEILNGIKYLKLYAWEDPFITKVETHRNNQLRYVSKRNIYWMFSQMVTQVSMGLVLFSTLVTYVLLGNELTASVAFTSITILVNLRRAIEFLPEALQRFFKLMISDRRISNFLQCPEIQLDNLTYVQESKDIQIVDGQFDWNDSNGLLDQVEGDDINPDKELLTKSNHSKKSKTASTATIEFINENNGEGVSDSDIVLSTMSPSSQPKYNDSTKLLGSIQQEPRETSVLNNVDFRAPAGKLTVICGKVGSGKTSLVSSLIGELYKCQGSVSTYKHVAFTTQIPFLVSGTFRENILFGKPYDRERYIKVLDACSLNIDLLQLPGRDLTEIGERGLNISGGQKQRISLARALYTNADCFIMDEVLSAVDSEVAKHLFDHCIQGMMKDKTRILITHQLQFVPSADHIVVVEDGVLTQGTYEELKEKGIDFESIMKTKQLNEEDSNTITQSSAQTSDNPMKKSNQQIIPPTETLIINSEQDESNLAAGAKLLVKEDRNKGAIGWGTYLPYFKSGGSIWIFGLIIFFYISSQVMYQSSDYWLVVWSQHQITNKTDKYYMLVYMGLILIYIILLVIRYFSLSKFTIAASRKIHRELLNRVMFSSQLFFDQNPSGRILNRFSKDISDIDISLVEVYSDVLYCGSSVLVSIGIMSYVNPPILVPLLALGFIYFFIQKVYRYSSRELKRMESISKSPMFSLVSEAYSGMVTIRSYQQEERFVDEINEKIDVNTRLFFYSFAVHRWIGIRLEFLSSVCVLFASIFSVFSHNPGLAGLSVTSALGLTGFLNWAVRQYTELEVKMNSVERVNKYISNPPEGDRYSLEGPILARNWPHQGEIKFDSLEIRYREGMEPSLRRITCQINPGEKIGIVGRTGAGKSTIGVALFRMVNPSFGSIIIDGVNISEIGLHELRSRLGVIPQESFIFSGTVRENIDPLQEKSDQEVWDSLEQVQMKSTIASLPQKLDTNIMEGGDGFSVGQKQLLCLCRALLRNPKIVLMDEATSSLDYHTDAVIKDVISKNFKDSTVLTIAHRLDTIFDSTRIMVIDKGNLVEFDTPKALISDPNSRYTKLLKAQSTFLFNK
eukprot:gene1119-1424_t